MDSKVLYIENKIEAPGNLLDSNLLYPLGNSPMHLDQELVKLAKAGKESAQRALYDKYNTQWFMMAQRYMRSREDALDVLQNAMVNIFTKMEQYQEDKASFSTWSNRIIINECIEQLRKFKNIRNTEEITEEINLVDESESAFEIISAEDLTKLIQQLPDGYRTVFNLYVLEGYTHKEIATALGISEGASKSQLFKAKQTLKKQLEMLF